MALDLVGFGSAILMLMGLGIATWQMFADQNTDVAVAGLALCFLGADFTLLYLIRVEYLEWGILTYTLFGCFSLIVILTGIRGIIPDKL